MGYEGDVKNLPSARVQPVRVGLSIKESVMAATAAFRDEFKQTLGSEPIVEYSDKEFQICTFGAGKFEVVGQFGITELPGCCGVAVFYHASVAQQHRDKGLGKLFLQIRMKAAVLAGYSVGLATVLKYNEAEISILKGLGWSEYPGLAFKNKRTKNDVIGFTRVL